jgi:hypothetical protein
MTIDGLNLLWLHDQPGCDRFYPLRDPDPSPQQAKPVPELCLAYEADSDRG